MIASEPAGKGVPSLLHKRVLRQGAFAFSSTLVWLSQKYPINVFSSILLPLSLVILQDATPLTPNFSEDYPDAKEEIDLWLLPSFG